MIELINNYWPIISLVVFGIVVCMGVLLYDIVRDTPSKDATRKL